MLIGAVALHDVRDVGGFVNAAICRMERQHGRLGVDEREELELDGFEIMCQLAQKFRPRGPTVGEGFSAYASELFPGRLITAWHRQHRGSHVRTRVNGRCVWDYRPPAASLDQLLDRAATWTGDDYRPAPTFDETRFATITRFQKPAAAPAPALAAA